jgi:hypothetical protein
MYNVGGTLDKTRDLIKRLARGIGGNVTTWTITNEDEVPNYKEY